MNLLKDKDFMTFLNVAHHGSLLILHSGFRASEKKNLNKIIGL